LTHNNIFLIRQNKTVAVVLFLLKLAAVFACSATLCMFLLKQKQSSAEHAKACFCLSKNMQSVAEHAKTAKRIAG
jgi:hypothetical protein